MHKSNIWRALRYSPFRARIKNCGTNPATACSNTRELTLCRSGTQIFTTDIVRTSRAIERQVIRRGRSAYSLIGIRTATPKISLSTFSGPTQSQRLRESLIQRLERRYKRHRGRESPEPQSTLIRSQVVGFERLHKGPGLRIGDFNEYLIVHESHRSLAEQKKKREETVGKLLNRTKQLGSAFTRNRGFRRPLQGFDKMRSWVQFLTTPTADTPGTALLLHFDKKRYLIGNISEGTQRACVQRKAGLSRVEDIFLTGTIDWHSTGGILGMILTLADVIGTQQATLEANEKNKEKKGDKNASKSEGPRKLRLHGSKNLTHLLATSRRFIFRKGMPVEVNEIREDLSRDSSSSNIPPTWTDENIRVWAMPISPTSASAVQKQRKRTFDDTIKSDTSSDALLTINNPETPEEREEREDQLRKGVVAHMFNSDWRLDALVPRKLENVRLPATIFVRNDEGKIEKYTGPLPGVGEAVPDIEVLVRNPWPGASIEALPPTQPSPCVVSYIFKNHPQRGKFKPQEALRLGVQKGKAFSSLAAGHNVTTSAGQTITPEMVLEPGKEGGGLAVVELPDTTYIEPTLARPEWKSKEVMEGVGAIVWICGEGVAKDRELQRFISTNGLENIISSPDTCPNMLALESPAAAAIRLNLIDPPRFPRPGHSNEPRQPVKLPGTVARVGKQIDLEPVFNVIDDHAIGFLDTEKVVQEMPTDVLELAAEAHKKIEDPAYLAQLAEKQSDIPSLDAEITTLGTGSALPSKYRNVSATLLRVPGYGNYLFDCGENTLGQLKRVFGAELPGILLDLKAIWISHLHADHHLGTAAVIRAWHEVTREDQKAWTNRLMVASDEGMLKWLDEYSNVEDYGYARVDALSMEKANNLQEIFSPKQTLQYGLLSIRACYVSHCHGALAVVFDFPNGFRVAYSGDCRPSQEFARIGHGATLLIHEATFDDELQGDAIAKKHSTTSEALDIGKRMGARRILLTHFSQRYQKIPVMDKSNGQDQVAIVAFDYMQCRIGDFAKLSEFRPALSKLYEEKEED